MKNILLAISLVFIFSSSNAQLDSINISQFKKNIDSKISFKNIIKEGGDSADYCQFYKDYEGKLRKISIDISTQTINIIESNKVVKVQNKKMAIDEIIRMKNLYFMIGHTDNKGNPAVAVNTYQFYITPFNIQSLTCFGQPILFNSTTENVYNNDGFKYDLFDFSISPDSTKIAFIIKADIKKNEPQKFHSVILDISLNVLLQKDITLKYMNDEFLYKGVMVTDKAQIIINGFVEIPNTAIVPVTGLLLSSPFFDELNSFSAEVAHDNIWQTHILFYTFDGNENLDYQFANSDTRDDGVLIKLLENNHVFYAGFFADKNSIIETGIFIHELDPESYNIVNTTQKPIEDSIVQKIVSAEKFKKGKRLEHFKIRDILKRNDGNYYIVTEKRGLSINIGFGGEYYFDYNAKELMVVSVSSDFEINWIMNIDKPQLNETNRNSKVSYFMNNDQLNFLWNADKSISNNSKLIDSVENKSSLVKNNYVINCTVFPDSKTEYKDLNSSSVILTMDPQQTIQLDEFHLLFTAEFTRRNTYSKSKGFQIINLDKN